MDEEQKKAKEIIELLRTNGHTISFMESCTGGALSNYLTNFDGSSDVFKFGAVTYSTAFKLKLGVNYITVDKYSVYSPETAKEMAKKIAIYAESNIGVGVTGKLGSKNDKGSDDDKLVYISIYVVHQKKYYSKIVKIEAKNRSVAKEAIVKIIINDLHEIIKANNYV